VRARAIPVLLAVSLLAPALPAGDKRTANLDAQRLFHIERSKNANIVAYDVLVDPDGNPDAKRPIDAYWILAADGEREALSGVEKRLAYGFKTRFTGPGVVMLRLAADIDRDITVERVQGAFRAIVDIAGQPAVLDRIYVQSVERRLWLPSVKFVDLFGTALQTGAELHERIPH